MNVQHNKAECGSILVIILIFITALLILGGALSIVTLSENFIAHNQEEDARLYYITEAGIEAGAAALSRLYDYDWPINGSVDGGDYDVQIVKEPGLAETHPYYEMIPQRLAGDQRLVISTGSLNGKSMVMAVIVETGEDPVTNAFPNTFEDLPDEFGAEGVVITEWINSWRL